MPDGAGLRLHPARIRLVVVLAGVSRGTNRVSIVSLPVLEGFSWINPEESRDPNVCRPMRRGRCS
jgi:hypothetical protein